MKRDVVTGPKETVRLRSQASMRAPCKLPQESHILLIKQMRAMEWRARGLGVPARPTERFRLGITGLWVQVSARTSAEVSVGACWTEAFLRPSRRIDLARRLAPERQAACACRYRGARSCSWR